MKLTHYLLIGCLCTFLSCKQETPQAEVFTHDLQPEQAKPWTHDNFDNSDEGFTFALFGDLTGGERDSIFRVGMAQLNLLRPELIVNVGDLIDGDYKEVADLHRQWESFDQRAKQARAPVFYVGGNHDLTDEQMWQVWDERYGRRYYHFVYKNVLFLVLDTEDYTVERVRQIETARARAMDSVAKFGWGILNQTVYHKMPEQISGEIRQDQADYFQNVIASNPRVMHTFLLMHKAPWKSEDPEFVQIEQALKDMPYTVFNGHKHAFDHEQRNGRDYIRMATTGGVHLPNNGRSADHITLVTVDKQEASIAHLLMAGILDKTGNIPLNGGALCFETTLCKQLTNTVNPE